MSTAIRELGLADAAKIEALLDALSPGWIDALAPGASGTIAFAADGPTFLLAAYVDDAPAGWLWGVHVRRPDGRIMSYIHQIDVLVEYRRRGLAASLVEAAQGLARRAGSHRLWLVTQSNNDAAQRLYESTGAERGTGPGAALYLWNLD